MPDHGAEFDETLRAASCARRGHEHCPHVAGLGGGFNPRRLRPEFGAGLCPCSCHASCPVTIPTKRMTVPMKTWYTSCTCRGAEAERQRLDEAGIEVRDFSDVRADVRRQSQARKDAYAAARARAAGRSREQIRDMYVAELQARGLTVPAEPVLDAVVDRINGNPLPAARVLGANLVQLGKTLHELSQLFRRRRR